MRTGSRIGDAREIDGVVTRLAGKVAIVTGGTRGIGHALVRGFLAEGASVLWTGTSEPSVDAAAGRLPQGAHRGCTADLADPAAPQRVVRAALDAFGGLDVLVNNAGVADAPDIWAADAADWDRVMNVNLRAAFLCTREAARAMRDRDGGSIVNVSSIAGQIGGIATGPAYVAAKAGLIGLTRSLARHLAPLGIRVNCVAPADIETDMTADWPEPLKQRLIAMTPLGRFGRTDEVTGAAVFLASGESSYITGQTLNVNGGAYMG
jgi:3-oxoacyl-[acyl-carrier protein] reductase